MNYNHGGRRTDCFDTFDMNLRKKVHAETRRRGEEET